MDYSIYLKETRLLDFSHPSIANLPQWEQWNTLEEKERAGAIYDFVRNDIAFGYNSSDDIKASAVLADGYGQCNTKGTLLMALLRKAGIPCRLHGFTIHKKLQAGAIPPFLQRIAPDEIIHSWVEALIDGKWLKLEGFILDTAYLAPCRISSFISTAPSAGTPSLPVICKTPKSNGAVRTPSYKRMESPRITVFLIAPMLFTAKKASIFPESNHGPTRLF